jgi:hypothetical protein
MLPNPSRGVVACESCAAPGISPLEQGIREGDSPVCSSETALADRVTESSCLGLQLKAGGKFHLRLNTGGRPIANKYCEGKMKRTLKRELKSA